MPIGVNALGADTVTERDPMTGCTDVLEGPVGACTRQPFVKLDAAVRMYLHARHNELALASRIQIAAILYAIVREIGPDLLVKNFQRRHVETWLSSLTVSPATIRSRLSALRTFSKWCLAHGYMKKDPTFGVNGPRIGISQPRELSQLEVAKVLANAPDLRAEVIILFAVSAGLRVSEIAGARREDLDLDGRTLTVVGKGRKERTVWLGDELLEAVSSYIGRNPGRSGPLVRSETNPTRGLTAGHIGKIASGWMREAGVKAHAYDGRSAHAFRHTAAGQMLDDGADLRQVQVALGHDRLSTTAIYTRRRYAADQLAGVMGIRRYGIPTPKPVQPLPEKPPVKPFDWFVSCGAWKGPDGWDHSFHAPVEPDGGERLASPEVMGGGSS